MADSFIRPGPLGAIALGIRARLELAFPPAKFSFQWMPGRVDKKVWMELTRRMPMIGIGFTGLEAPQTTSFYAGSSHWMVYLATRNSNGAEAVLFGDKFAPGQLQLAEVAASLLHGFLVPCEGMARVQEVANSYVEDYEDAGLSITAISLNVPVDLSPPRVWGDERLTATGLSGETIQWSFDGGATIVQTDVTTIPKGET